MKNRSVEFFNLSFLDLLTGALAAIIFLFIIVPKGNITIADTPLPVTYDTLQNQFHGFMPDTMLDMQVGDTLLAVISELKAVPKSTSKPAPLPAQASPRRTTPKKSDDSKSTKEEAKETSKVTVTPSTLKGSKPDVPCKVSFEIKWYDKKDNVDLFVCKDNACVFGRKRFLNFIGYWDSGKARSSLFGGDLRTNQEAVRQFDEIIPGVYEIFAQYKESEEPKSDLQIRLQVYTKNNDDLERGHEHYFALDLNPTDRTHIARVTIGPEGQIEFESFK